MAQIDDAVALCRLQRRAITSIRSYTRAQRGAWLASISPAYLRLTLQHRTSLACESRGRIAGFGQLDVVRSRVTAIYVDPMCRGCGVGGGLLSRLMQLAVGQGLEVLTLQSSPDAISFYQRRGFVATTSRRVVMPDALSLEVVEMICELTAAPAQRVAQELGFAVR